MILADLKTYLQQHRQASLIDLSRHFDTDPEVLRTMLALWVRKGQVERFSFSPQCGESCQRCAPESTEIYRWKPAE